MYGKKYMGVNRETFLIGEAPHGFQPGLLQSSHEGIAVGHFLPHPVFACDSGEGCFSLHCDPCPTHIRSEDKHASVLLNPWGRCSHILSMPGKFHGEQL